MTTERVISDRYPDLRLLWGDELPDELAPEEVEQLTEQGFLMFGFYDKDEEAIGFKFLGEAGRDKWTILRITRHPTILETAADYDQAGTYFGLESNIESVTAESCHEEIVALQGLVNAFKLRRGIEPTPGSA